MPVRNFPYWTGLDYVFRQPFCLVGGGEGGEEADLMASSGWLVL